MTLALTDKPRALSAQRPERKEAKERLNVRLIRADLNAIDTGRPASALHLHVMVIRPPCVALSRGSTAAVDEYRLAILRVLEP